MKWIKSFNESIDGNGYYKMLDYEKTIRLVFDSMEFTSNEINIINKNLKWESCKSQKKK